MMTNKFILKLQEQVNHKKKTSPLKVKVYEKQDNVHGPRITYNNIPSNAKTSRNWTEMTEMILGVA